MVIRLAFETLIRLAIVEQVTDTVHRVFENRSCGKYDHSDLWIHEWNDIQSRNETSNFSSEAEVFERFHDTITWCQRSRIFFRDAVYF